MKKNDTSMHGFLLFRFVHFFFFSFRVLQESLKPRPSQSAMCVRREAHFSFLEFQARFHYFLRFKEEELFLLQQDVAVTYMDITPPLLLNLLL